MSKASQDLVEHTARLARLDISPAEARALGEQFEKILAAFQTIASLDVDGVEPMTGPTEITDVKREDMARPSLPLERALANAPEPREGFYGVPKTIGGEA